MSAGTIARFDGRITDAAALAVRSTTDNTATASSEVSLGGLIAVALAFALAEVTSGTATSAEIGTPAYIQIPKAVITVAAASTDRASASAGGGSGGLISVRRTEPLARVASLTSARSLGWIGNFTSGEDVTGDPTLLGTVGASQVDIAASANAATTSRVSSGSGGVIASDASTATAVTAPTVEVLLVGLIVAGRNITAVASASTDADAFADSSSGGVLRLSDLNTSASATPVITATAGPGALLFAPGTVLIRAVHGGAPPVSVDDSITSVNTGTDELGFGGAHGMAPGDELVYDAAR